MLARGWVFSSGVVGSFHVSLWVGVLGEVGVTLASRYQPKAREVGVLQLCRKNRETFSY